MLGFRLARSTVAFNKGILTTFGKLDHADIAMINGSEERLVEHLVLAYGWTSSEANSKVQQFRLVLASTPRRRGVGAIHD
jgi:hypothetical protein